MTWVSRDDMFPTNRPNRARLVYGDGTQPCRDCRVALNDSSFNFCQACGGPLKPGFMRRNPADRAISVTLARREAAAR